MKKSTPFWTMYGCLVLSLAVFAQAAEPSTFRPNFGPSKVHIKPNLTNLPIVNAKTSSPRIQSASEYRVIDSLFNAYSFYGGEQQPIAYDPASGLFVIIKRGALPPENTSANNSNSLRLLVSTNMGQKWSANLPLYKGGGNGNPRYPSVDIAMPAGHTDPAEAFFCFTAPLTNGATGVERSWQGSVLGTQSNDASAAVVEDLTAEVDVKDSKFWWGTDCTPITYQSADGSKILFSFAVDLIPSDSSSTPSELLNAEGLIQKDFQSAVAATATIPSAWVAEKFRTVESHSGAWRTHVGYAKDKAGTYYNAVFGNFVATADTNHHTFGVSKSTDNGKTWGDFNIMPYSVFAAYATSIGNDPDSCIFDWRRTSPAELTTYSFVPYGNGNFSCFTQFYTFSTQPTATHIVECYYVNGQWGMRKVAYVSMFENADFWLQFDQDGTTGPSQMGNEMQACNTADENTLVLKYVEAKIYAFTNEGGDPDTLLTTDVVLCTRGVGDNSWSKVKNVTQSNIIDRTTWLPRILPSDLKNIPLVTVQTAEKGSSIRENLYESQMRMATSNVDSYDAYKQYVTISNFNVADLPDWNGLPTIGVTDESSELNQYLSISPNPANDVVTIGFNSQAQNGVLQVINELGQVVFTQNVDFSTSGTHFHTFGTNNFENGSYVVRLTADAKVYSKSLTIVR